MPGSVPSVPQRLVRGSLLLSLLAMSLPAVEASADEATSATVSSTATVTFRDAAGAVQTPVTATASVTLGAATVSPPSKPLPARHAHRGDASLELEARSGPPRSATPGRR